MTLNQAHELADWIAASGKNLKLIYATHGHGDHFFGAGTILERFPGARFVARPDVVQVMRTQVSPQWLSAFWQARFPDQIPENIVIADELEGDVIKLEGRDLI